MESVWDGGRGIRRAWPCRRATARHSPLLSFPTAKFAVRIHLSPQFGVCYLSVGLTKVASGETDPADVPTWTNVHPIPRRSFADVLVCENLAVIFPVPKFPAVVFLRVLDGLTLLFPLVV